MHTTNTGKLSQMQIERQNDYTCKVENEADNKHT